MTYDAEPNQRKLIVTTHLEYNWRIWYSCYIPHVVHHRSLHQNSSARWAQIQIISGLPASVFLLHINLHWRELGVLKLQTGSHPIWSWAGKDIMSYNFVRVSRLLTWQCEAFRNHHWGGFERIGKIILQNIGEKRTIADKAAALNK